MRLLQTTAAATSATNTTANTTAAPCVLVWLPPKANNDTPRNLATPLELACPDHAPNSILHPSLQPNL